MGGVIGNGVRLHKGYGFREVAPHKQPSTLNPP